MHCQVPKACTSMSSLLFHITADSNWKQLKRTLSWNQFHLCYLITHICWRYLQLRTWELWQATVFFHVRLYCFDQSLLYSFHYGCYRFSRCDFCCSLLLILFEAAIFWPHTRVCCSGDPYWANAPHVTIVVYLLTVDWFFSWFWDVLPDIFLTSHF